MTETVAERETREWFVMDEGSVKQSLGFSCSPNNPHYWWFPRIGFSMAEGVSVFATRAEAVAAARRWIEKQRQALDAKERELK